VKVCLGQVKAAQQARPQKEEEPQHQAFKLLTQIFTPPMFRSMPLPLSSLRMLSKILDLALNRKGSNKNV
jgi:hypothetical protein